MFHPNRRRRRRRCYRRFQHRWSLLLLIHFRAFVRIQYDDQVCTVLHVLRRSGEDGEQDS
jgi:hypothetical protein